jgi:hypothetical protein
MKSANLWKCLMVRVAATLSLGGMDTVMKGLEKTLKSKRLYYDNLQVLSKDLKLVRERMGQFTLGSSEEAQRLSLVMMHVAVFMAMERRYNRPKKVVDIQSVI